MTARVGLYYAPTADDPLSAAAARWLGRDAETDAPLPQPDIAGIEAATREPRGYGFHATLKPPMRLIAGTGWDEVRRLTRTLAAATAPFDLPPLGVADIHGFLALRETAPCPRLRALADACVAQLDPLRAPPDAAELGRRRRAGLSPEQDAMLRRWGYPYVFATWFFHMTLTRRLDAAEQSVFRPAAAAHFAAALARPRRVADIALFTQAAPGAPFVIAERFPLRG